MGSLQFWCHVVTMKIIHAIFLWPPRRVSHETNPAAEPETNRAREGARFTHGRGGTPTGDGILSSLLLVSLFLMLLLSPRSAIAVDTLSKGRNITDNGTTLVSADGGFTMGFFSPAGVSTSKRYLGVWFTVSSDVVCWVANRDRPINDDSGVLYLNDTGSLVLLESSSGRVAWSSNSSAGAALVVEAQLLDNGDLEVHNQGSTAALWHSFDYPHNVLLSDMKLGKDFINGYEWYLTSWHSIDDPSSGAYTRKLDTNGLPDVMVYYQGTVVKYRSGPWNGLTFGGIPEVNQYKDGLFDYQMIISSREITFGYKVKPNATYTYSVLTEGGMVRRMVWENSTRAWRQYYQGPRDVCDNYGHCGAFGVCNISAAATSFCTCLTGYSPASPSTWPKDGSGGCRRNVKRECGQTTDGFLPVRSVKLPHTHNATVDTTISMEQCRVRCLANCSCLAYAPSTLSVDSKYSGCVMWWDDLIDLRYIDSGQDMYLRLTVSELPPPPSSPPSKSFPTRVVAAVGAAVGFIIGITLIAALVFLFVIKKRGGPASSPANYSRANYSHVSGVLSVVEMPHPATPTVPRVGLSSLREATENFSEGNIIGRGGFGIVYEGRLPDAGKVAVKKLIQPPNDAAFMREVKVMSSLGHDNLCQLLFYCNEENEQILVYKYMEKSSLQIYIFGEDPRRRALLDWERRLEIILGVAKGVAYLHEHRPEVIHRDLKPPNILLDDDWGSKIADFGTAKIFVVNETDPTLIQSAGYTLTLKCDVYSFGVIILEVVSGRRNKDSPTLFSDAWKAWDQQKISELVDPAVPQPRPEDLLELEKCVQIGLHCVQQSPDDRPTMSDVITRLRRNGPPIPHPREPVLGRRNTSPVVVQAARLIQEALTSRSSSHDGSTQYQTPPVSDTVY